jgi:membrane fusion protein
MTSLAEQPPSGENETARLGLFRQEALGARRQTLEGDVIVLSSVWGTYTTIGLFAAVVIVGAFLAMSDIPRIQQVPGWLTTTRGLVAIQALRSGIVEKVLVREGQIVEPGEILATIQVDQLQPDIGRTPSQMLLAVLHGEDEKLRDQIQLTSQQADQDKHRLGASVAALRQEIIAINVQITHQKEMVSLAKHTARVGEDLAKQGALSRLQASTEESDWAQKARDLATFQQTRASLTAQLDAAIANLNSVPITRDTTIANLQVQRAGIQQQVVQTQGARSYAITAPVAGRVTSLVARPGYAEDGQHALMLIVPAHARLLAQLFVPSSAIAFIKPGQSVRLLYDALPFEQFGSQLGTVTSVSSSARLPADVIAPVQIHEPVYLVDVALDHNAVKAFGSRVPLRAGMTLEADVVLESRSVFEWLFEPLFAVRGHA